MSSIQKRDAQTFRVMFRHLGKQRSLTFNSLAAAKKWQQLLEAVGYEEAIARLEGDKPKTSLGEFLASHIENLTGVTNGTRASYKGYISTHMGELGKIPLASLDRTHVSKWINELAAKGLSGKTIRNVHGFLSGALNEAVRQKLLAENPCTAMRMPTTSHKSTEMTFLTHDEFAELFALIDPHYRPLVLTLVGTGMRFGEATALMVGDVDLEHHQLRVRQAWKKTGDSSRELGAPKTKRSIRTIPLGSEVEAALSLVCAGKSHNEFVFTNKQGAPVNSSSFREGVWLPAVQEFAGDEVEIRPTQWNSKKRIVIKQGNGKHPRIHDLRHTFASWAIQANKPLTVIQRTLGHESITTTVDRYSHLARSDFDSLATSINDFLPKHLSIDDSYVEVEAIN